jgi:hypothetical protein
MPRHHAGPAATFTLRDYPELWQLVGLQSSIQEA